MITILILFAIHYVIRKNRKLLWSQIICIFLLNLQMTTIGDYFLAMPPYDFYDTVDRNSGELMDIFLQNIVYPGTVLFLMDRYKRYRPSKVVFIIVSALILTVLEGISVNFFHLFTYKGWKIYYSFFFYVFTMTVNVLFYEKITCFIEMRQMSKRTT
ncbi:CBO0543 family protein [Cytobacillus sp. FJAT-54145]|uniref:CBO0543 family protein n=1 Tax=Cytobacillus spartinae TaxID=3299023 RepID=A0ABW6K6S3_9BACI